MLGMGLSTPPPPPPPLPFLLVFFFVLVPKNSVLPLLMSCCSSAVKLLRMYTCGLKGWSCEMRKISGNFSRNFFSPPKLSLSTPDRLGFAVASCSILPISPTGMGPFSSRTTWLRVLRALWVISLSRRKEQNFRFSLRTSRFESNMSPLKICSSSSESLSDTLSTTSSPAAVLFGLLLPPADSMSGLQPCPNLDQALEKKLSKSATLVLKPPARPLSCSFSRCARTGWRFLAPACRTWEKRFALLDDTLT
mmetsp:Transcript_23677/g.47085  ORF Transcript_23677/g.47085 Transcript_23677/m.47085 type:complete len:250 (+) Transcript_23677:190-939(+)